MKRWITLLAALALLAGLCACGGGHSSPEDDGTLRLTASAFPEYDLLRAVAGEEASVTLLLKPGTEAHTYEPTPQDLLTLCASDLFVYGGGESDAWADRLLETEDAAAVRTLALMDYALLRKEETLDYMTVEEAEAEEDSYDEHVWTSPLNEIRLTEALRDTLSELDPAHADRYAENAAERIRALEALDEAFRGLTETAARRLIVVGDRFPFLYFVREYGLEYAAAFPGCSAESETDPVTMAELIRRVREAQVPVVFKCDLSSGKTAETVAEETGAAVGTLYSGHVVSAEDFSAGVTMLTLMERNLEALREALN